MNWRIQFKRWYMISRGVTTAGRALQNLSCADVIIDKIPRWCSQFPNQSKNRKQWIVPCFNSMKTNTATKMTLGMMMRFSFAKKLIYCKGIWRRVPIASQKFLFPEMYLLYKQYIYVGKNRAKILTTARKKPRQKCRQRECRSPVVEWPPL